MPHLSISILLATLLTGAAELPFPAEIVNFTPYQSNPVFEPGGPDCWDTAIRERGWILQEDGTYHLWYTGYRPGDEQTMQLGYATSPDGISWTRFPGNPIYTEHWVEDMMVVKQGATYYMFAEGKDDQAHLLTSTDRVHWTRQGVIDIRKVNGEPLDPGPFGTPAAFYENGTWYLLYERDDEAVWLATSKDMKVWTNVQDEPVLRPGPEPYDVTMIAVNQVVQYNGIYYAYYHATCPENGRDRWSMCVAASADRIHWEKYAGNPIIEPDHSSGILVHDDQQYRMYTMHRAVDLFFPKTSSSGDSSDDSGEKPSGN